MTKATHIIRWLISAGLLYGVWTETGIWTTVMLGLVVIGHEVTAWSRRKNQRFDLVRDLGLVKAQKQGDPSFLQNMIRDSLDSTKKSVVK